GFGGKLDEKLTRLAHARQIFELAECALDVARCDLLRAFRLDHANQDSNALEILLALPQKFAQLGAPFFAAQSHLLLGIVYRHLNQFDESLKASFQARDYFQAQDIRAQVSACDINLGNAYFALNRYDEALGLYEQAAAFARADGRARRAARIYNNIGLVYAKQGRFANALDLHQRALQIATREKLPTLAAGIHAGLAACYRQLGQFDEALAHLRARETLTPSNANERVASRQIDLADVCLARGDTAQAVECLGVARRAADAENLDSYVALCDRLLAQTNTLTPERARMQIANARALFLKHSQIVDAALCDLTEGELRLEWNEMAAACECFERARAVLGPGFPDYAWRADYGLARCRRGSAALAHYRRATQTIADTRALLVSEQLSNAFLARRQSVYDDALSTALAQEDRAVALEIIEASKARAFLALIQHRGWKLRDDRRDSYVAELLARERDLRYQLDAQRARATIQIGKAENEAARAASAARGLPELNALSQAYESVVTRLRLAATGLAGVAAPAPFALDRFRAAASARLGNAWSALDYFLSGDELAIAVVTPTEVRVERKTLSRYDRAILDKCSSQETDLRELVYRGTLRGSDAPSPGANYLRHLDRLLIPARLERTLIISPHRSLHALPFHALLDGNEFLLERHTIVYAPSLQTCQLLLEEKRDSAATNPLIVGLSQFGAAMRALPAAAAEVARVQEAFGGRGVTLCEADATRQAILAFDASHELAKFDVLHFASHAILDRAAPHQSRILLRGDALTALDILDLTLDARLVTLSACQSALGQGGAGDELIGIARAFFYAGARALLASLWQVEDEATTKLLTQFYRYLINGKDAASALRCAQIELLHAGQPPYHWAAFGLLGQP
ncbi:MAG: CHAT domain-containing tetratricopeptide repeat protein, partial [Chloroflexota bacterium]